MENCNKKFGKTITTYLIEGDPNGAQYVFISNRTCQMYVIPRSGMSIIKKRKDLTKPSLYILIGEDDDLSPKAYIGETENFIERIKDHQSQKPFWQKALIFISKDAALTKSDIQYLEYLAIKVANNSKQYLLDENKNMPKSPNLPEYQKNTIDEFFEDIKLLTSFIGYNIFEIVREKSEHLFFIGNKDNFYAKGFYNENGFIVLENSIISKSTADSYISNEKRKALIHQYVVERGDGKLVVNKNITFASPSGASNFVLGRNSNGWTEWKDNNGRTLDDIYRKPLED